MATATKNPPPQTPPPTYTLELSQEEAQTLADVLSRVGGSMTDSRRRHTQAILDTLGDVGVNFGNKPDLGNGGLVFAPDRRQPHLTIPPTSYLA